MHNIDRAHRLRQELDAATEAKESLARELEQTRSDLGVALGAALAAVDDPKDGIKQLTALLATARKLSADRGTELAPHWRMAEALLPVMTDNLTGRLRSPRHIKALISDKTDNPTDDTPAGGSIR